MRRTFFTVVLAAVVAIFPLVRAGCDLTCFPAVRTADVAPHCPTHAARQHAPAAPERCSHDHQAPVFVASSSAATHHAAAPMIGAATPTVARTVFAPPAVPSARLARAGHAPPPRHDVLRI